MELDLLRRRAEKISSGSSSAWGGLDNEFRLLPGENFSCSGNMTGLLLVGAVMKKMGMRDEYPEIQIWRNTGGDMYTRNGSQEIKLARGDFSPDGVLQYNLITPITYESGDVLGVYQPPEGDSVVRVYYDANASTTYRLSDNNPITIPNLLSDVEDHQRILISPISG